MLVKTVSQTRDYTYLLRAHMIKGGGDEVAEDEACGAREDLEEAREVQEEVDGHAEEEAQDVEEEARDVEDPEEALGVAVGGEDLVVEGDRASFSSCFSSFFFLFLFFTML
ncbi:hypothetical protein FH972_020899 [Carpinus fangiana]|uniref:Uncharacterized protein n=1 Tax=Carpinus fangiana TaxID=176857 RepID=A0A5N6RUX1_9ROSI|nr:hypothetical protein FH972_020899 [Carpinus fangiana]